MNVKFKHKYKTLFDKTSFYCVEFETILVIYKKFSY